MHPSRFVARVAVLVIGLLLGIALLVLLLRTVSPATLGRAFAGADYWYLAAGMLPFVLILGAKVSRWQLLFGPGPPRWWTLFGAISVGYAVNTVVPLRMGEIVTAYWVRDRESVGMAKTLGTVAVERVTDGLAVLLLLVLFAPTVAFPPALLVPVVAVGAALLVLLAILLGAAVVSAGERAWLRRLDTRLRETRARVLAEWISQAFAGTRAIADPRRFLLYLLYTAFIWSANSVLLWLLVRAFHLDVPLAGGFLLTGVLFLGMAVPSSPGYLGVFDYLMVLMLGLYGVAHGPAVAAALAAHVVTFVPVTVVGLLLLAHHGAGRALGVFASPGAVR